jgi:hypothetical protein
MGIFFLDSVDEAKIAKATDFYSALDCFLDQISRSNISRTIIVISSRISEWAPGRDAAEVASRFASNVPAQGAKMAIVQIAPLDRSGVKKYIQSRCGTEADRFLDELSSAYAWDFARRPADVDDLYTYWHDKGRFGSVSEMLDFTVERQLRLPRERDRHDTLSLERAREGAQHLAAAIIFWKRFSFRIPDSTALPQAALEPIECLQRYAKHYYTLRRRLTYRRLRGEFNKLRYRWDLFRKNHELAAGKYPGALSDLIMEAPSHDEYYIPKDLNRLAERRGTRIAAAVRQGCKSFWRSFAGLSPRTSGGPRYDEGHHRRPRRNHLRLDGRRNELW